MGSDNRPSNMSATMSFVLRAEVEQPQLEVRSQRIRFEGGEHVLDYGLMVAGSSVKFPLELVNHGHVELPLEVLLTSDVSGRNLPLHFSPFFFFLIINL